MKKILIVGAAILVMAALYAAGRFTAPSKVVKTVDEQRVAQYEARITQLSNELETARSETKKHVVVVTRTNKKTGVTTTKRVEDVGTVTETRREEKIDNTTTVVDNTTTTVHTQVLTEREYPRLTLGADIGFASFTDILHPRWGLHAGYRFWGPLSVTARYEPQGHAVFAGLALTF